jgi:integrase
MRWHEISGDLWTIPAQRVKNGRTHVVPLSRQSLEIIGAQPEIGEGATCAETK